MQPFAKLKLSTITFCLTTMNHVNRYSLLLLLCLALPAVAPAQVERREKGNLVIEGVPEIPGTLTEKLY